MTLFTGFKKIVLSRFNNKKLDLKIIEKRKVCKNCEYNSINIDMVVVKKYKVFLKILSDFYSWITGNADRDILGNCFACEACSVYYKTEDEEVCPHPGGDKWKSIYIPNTAQKQKWNKK